MKQSINKIFNNLTLFLYLTASIAAVATIFIWEHNTSFLKIDSLNTQKSIINKLTKLNKDDSVLALIQINGKSKQLLLEVDYLKSLNMYDFTGNYLFATSKEYLLDLDRLTLLTTIFNEKALAYYNDLLSDKKSDGKNFLIAYKNITSHINSIIFKDTAYSRAKFNLLKNLAIISFITILFMTIWFRRRLNAIYKDIFFLYSVDNSKEKDNYNIFSEEVDAISHKMKRVTIATHNPDMIDTVTGINNHKGMLSSYAEKKGMKDSNFTSIAILEIDNFSKANRAFSQEFTQTILKKIAFTISLHEQATDVIARTDYNQFIIILSRHSREQAFKEIEIIRQGISEINFKNFNKEKTNITVSGGFVIKPNNTLLDEAIRQAKKVLLHAKSRGKNKISQVKDLAQDSY